MRSSRQPDHHHRQQQQADDEPETVRLPAPSPSLLPPYPHINNRALQQQQRQAVRGPGGRRGTDFVAGRRRQQPSLDYQGASSSCDDGLQSTSAAGGAGDPPPHVSSSLSGRDRGSASSSSTSAAPYNSQQQPQPRSLQQQQWRQNRDGVLNRRRVAGSKGMQRMGETGGIGPSRHTGGGGGSSSSSSSYDRQAAAEVKSMLWRSAQPPPRPLSAAIPLPPPDPDYVESSSASSCSDSDSGTQGGGRRKTSWWGVLLPKASRETQPLYLILVVGLAGLPHLYDKDQVVKLIVATATYGFAVVCSFFILQIITRVGLWQPPRKRGGSHHHRHHHHRHHDHGTSVGVKQLQEYKAPSSAADRLSGPTTFDAPPLATQRGPSRQQQHQQQHQPEAAARSLPSPPSSTSSVGKVPRGGRHEEQEEQTEEGKTTGPSEKEEEEVATAARRGGANETTEGEEDDDDDDDDDDQADVDDDWGGGDPTTGIEDSCVDEEEASTEGENEGATSRRHQEGEEEEEGGGFLLSTAPPPPPPPLLSTSSSEARRQEEDEQALADLRAALQSAQLEATTLKLKVNYYDMELHREKRERSAEMVRFMSRQKTDMSKLFGLMLKQSPRPLREALDRTVPDQHDVIAIVSIKPPFEILHVNKAWSDTFHWDDHEITGGGTTLSFFQGLVLDGSTWQDLLDTLALYGYASADILNCSGDGGGYFFHSMTVTPLVDVRGEADDDEPQGGRGMTAVAATSTVVTTRAPSSSQHGGDGHTAGSSSNGDGGNRGVTDVGGVKVQGHLVRSIVRTVPDLPAEIKRRLEENAATTSSVSTPHSYHDPPIDSIPEEEPSPSSSREASPVGDQPSALAWLSTEVGDISRRQPIANTLLAMNRSREALALVDLQGGILHINASFYRVTGHCLRTAEGKSVEEVGGGTGDDGKAGWEARVRERAGQEGSMCSTSTLVKGMCGKGSSLWAVSMAGLRRKERAYVVGLKCCYYSDEGEGGTTATTTAAILGS